MKPGVNLGAYPESFLDLRENDLYYHDEKAANDALKFFPSCLNHVTGEWAGKPFDLEPWQMRVVWDVYGWKRRSDGTRRFRLIYIYVPRKNGKTTFGAGNGLKGLCADGEPRAEVYSVAGDRGQAGIMHDLAKDMVTESEVLSSRLAVLQSSIKHANTHSFYKVLSADAKTKFGFNPHFVLFDELFVQPNRKLWDAFATAFASRRQPMMWAITTAGFDKTSLAYEVHDHARQVFRGVVQDDELYPVIFELGEKEDWTIEASWQRVNPCLGSTVKLEYLRSECKRAQRSPDAQNTFRRFHTNQWTKQENRWLDVDRWKDLASKSGRLRAELQGATCDAGLDLSSRIDLAACCLNFRFPDGMMKQLFHFWCPEQQIEERANRDRVPYDAWARAGWITPTRGSVIDYDKIRVDINAMAKEFKLRRLGIDEWNSTQLGTQLQGDGLEVVLMRQGFKTLSEPSKEFEALIKDKKLQHDGSPVMLWMIDNVATETDATENIKPSKELSRERIDGVAAAVMALGLTIRQPADKPSVYQSRGVRSV